MEITVSDLNSLSLIVALSFDFFYLNLGDDFFVGTHVLETFIIRYCEGRNVLVLIIQG